MSIKRNVYIYVGLSTIIPALVALYFLTNNASLSLPTRNIVFLLTFFIGILGIISLWGLLNTIVKLYKNLEKVAKGDVVPQASVSDASGVSDLAQSINQVSQQLRQNMDELQRRAILIERSHLELKRTHANQLQYLSEIVHELRAPLINIEKSSGMLLESAMTLESAGQANLVRMVNDNARRLLRLISDLLDISKMDAGELSLRLEKVPVEDILHEAFHAVDSWRKTRGLALEIKIGQGLEPMLSDKDRVVQVIVNLLSNAIKFTPVGGVITLEAHKSDKDEYVEFSVTDTGPGIAAGKQQVLFERFKTVSQPEDHSLPSTGLGLPISKQIVELLGGKLWLDSHPGSGTKFVFLLPQDSTASQAPKPVVAEVAKVHNIMVIDDDVDIRDLLGRELQKKGYTVTVAEDGLEALRKVSKETFDLVITDVRLPYMDGASCIEMLRKVAPRTAFIVITGYPVEGDLAAILTRNAYPCITKPFELNNLLVTVASTLQGIRP